MKKVTFIAGWMALVALTGCNNNKTETNTETPAPTQSMGSSTVDLSDKGVDGMDVTIVIPDSINSKIKFAKSDYTGTLDIWAGDKYKMRVTSNWASEEDPMDATLKERIGTIMHNIDTLTCKYLVKEPNLILWEYKTDDGQTGYHFYTQVAGGKTTFYSMEDNDAVVHTEGAIRSMVEISKSLTLKPVVAENP